MGPIFFEFLPFFPKNVFLTWILSEDRDSNPHWFCPHCTAIAFYRVMVLYCGGVTFGNLKVTYWPNGKVTKSIDSITFKRNAPLFTCALEEGRVCNLYIYIYILYIFQFDLISNQILISIWKWACIIRGPNHKNGKWKWIVGLTSSCQTSQKSI